MSTLSRSDGGANGSEANGRATNGLAPTEDELHGLDTHAIEVAVRGVAGVLNAVVVPIGGQTPASGYEVEVFVAPDVSEADVRQRVVEVVEATDPGGKILQITLVELAVVDEHEHESEPPVDAVAHGPAVDAASAGAPAPEPSTSAAAAGTTRTVGASRVRVHRAHIDTSRGRSKVGVALTFDDARSFGAAVGPTTTHDLHVVAIATLRALDDLIGQRGSFTLRAVAIVDMFERYSVCALVLREDNGQELLGASLVRSDGSVTDAAVRATLDAVNRQVESLLP